MLDWLAMPCFMMLYICCTSQLPACSCTCANGSESSQSNVPPGVTPTGVGKKGGGGGGVGEGSACFRRHAWKKGDQTTRACGNSQNIALADDHEVHDGLCESRAASEAHQVLGLLARKLLAKVALVSSSKVAFRLATDHMVWDPIGYTSLGLLADTYPGDIMISSVVCQKSHIASMPEPHGLPPFQA